MSETTQTSDLTSEELDGIMDALAAGNRKLPVDAIRAAQSHSKQMTPRLIEAIDGAHARWEADDDDMAAFFALFLLTEFQAKEALPAIVRAISLPDELPFEFFGDAVTETLPRILATLAADDLETIERLVADREIDRYVRGAAATSLVYLVADEAITRADAIARLRRIFQNVILERDEAGVEAIVLVLDTLGSHEAADEVAQAFERGLFEKWLINPGKFPKTADDGEVLFEKRVEFYREGTIVDTVWELESWSCFQETSESVGDEDRDWQVRPSGWKAFDEPRPEHLSSEYPSTIVNEQPRLGRNDPCHCGSGKKHKKCCLGK